MKTLLLKLAGPLQSWGTRANFQIRHTDYHPAKSGILGILLGSMGVRREESIDILEKFKCLDFAIRIDQPGQRLKDYHIAKSYKDGKVSQIYVTERYYLEDAVFLVALGSTDEDLISHIENSLKYPYFQPFMGRRSCPLPADFCQGVFDKNIIECLQEQPWQAARWFQKKYKKEKTYHTFLYADAHLIQEGWGERRRDKAISFSQKNRRFQYRYEVEQSVFLANPFYKENQEYEHDAFAEIGG